MIEDELLLFEELVRQVTNLVGEVKFVGDAVNAIATEMVNK